MYYNLSLNSNSINLKFTNYYNLLLELGTIINHH